MTIIKLGGQFGLWLSLAVWLFGYDSLIIGTPPSSTTPTRLTGTQIGQPPLPGVQLPPTPFSTPTPVGVVDASDPLLDFPLNLGNSWVYSATYYDTYGVEPITATYRITETVVDTRVYSSALAAQILRTSAVVTLSENLAGKDWQQYYLAGPGATGAYWYVISGTHLYQQDKLDWAKIASDEATLKYVFPLSVHRLNDQLDLIWEHAQSFLLG